MVSAPLTETADYPHLFRQRILKNTQYWRDFVTRQAADVLALDNERDGIITAIVFALDLEENWPLVYELIVAFSPTMERRGHWKIWNQLLDRAIQVAQKRQDIAGAVSLSILFARLWQRQSRPQETIHHYRQAIRLARQIGDEFSEARACSNLGYLYVEHGQWRRAEILCCHALAIFERLDSNHGRAHTENHLGSLYIRQCRWEQGRQHLERACALWQMMSDGHGLMRGFINLGLLYNEMECPHKALAYLEQALQQARLTGEEAETGKIYLNIGVAYMVKGEWIEAEQYIGLANAIFQRFSNSLDLAIVQENLGAIALEQQQLPRAKGHLQAALKAMRALDNTYGQIQTLIYFTKYELLSGHHQKAITRLREVEQQLERHNQAGKYHQLRRQVEKLRHRLAEEAFRPATATADQG